MLLCHRWGKWRKYDREFFILQLFQVVTVFPVLITHDPINKRLKQQVILIQNHIWLNFCGCATFQRWQGESERHREIHILVLFLPQRVRDSHLEKKKRTSSEFTSFQNTSDTHNTKTLAHPLSTLYSAFLKSIRISRLFWIYSQQVSKLTSFIVVVSQL